MKRSFSMLFVAGLLLFCGCRSGKTEEQPAELVITAASDYQIVYPDRAKNRGTAKLLKATAEKLARAFKETLGADFPVVRESRRKAGVKSIFLGDTRVLRANGVNPLRFKDFDFKIWEHKGNIYIAGSDRHRFNSDRPEKHDSAYILGTAGAAVFFMERFLDVRFLLPGETGTDYVKKDKIVIPANYKYKGTPALRYAPGGNCDLFYDRAVGSHGPGTLLSCGGSIYREAVPEKKYGREHPEYFAMRNSGAGKKRDSSGGGLCIGNEKVRELIFRRLLRDADSGAGTVELTQPDDFMPCECEKCAEYGGTGDPGEKLWIFHRTLADRFRRERPGKKLLISARGLTEKPPRSFRKFPSNVMIGLPRYTHAALEEWNKIEVPQGFLVCVRDWSVGNTPGFTPKQTPASAAARARRLIAGKVRGLCRRGSGGNFGLEGPVYYVYGKILDAPNRSEAEVTEEFFRRAFGESAAPMKEFYAALFKRLEICPAPEEEEAKKLPEKENPLRDPRILLARRYPADVLETLEKHLARAEKLARTPKVRKRLELVRLEFNCTRDLARILALFNSYRAAPGGDALKKLLDAIESRNKRIDALYDARDRMRRLTGWPELPVFADAPKSLLMTNGRGAAAIEAPLLWDVKLLREKGVPGAGADTVEPREKTK